MRKLGFLCLVIFGFAQTEAAACPTPMCAEPCTGGYMFNENGCMTCECLDMCSNLNCDKGKECRVFQLAGIASQVARCVDLSLPDKCQPPMDTGRCRASIPKWYYDTENEKCQEFNYGGCGGNSNQFSSLIDCQLECDPEAFNTRRCPLVMCMMYCSEGFEKDERGCDMCMCKKPSKTDDQLRGTQELPRCTPEVCRVCRTGFEEDMCKDCSCEDPMFNVEMGCDEEDERSCDKECEFGFQMDINGCQVCECSPPPSCPDIDCSGLACDHGLRHDEHGCQLCECRRRGECPVTRCQIDCPFGREMDSMGCEHCQCRIDPCKTMICPDDTYCKVNGSKAMCVMADSYNGACAEVMCAKQCIHGYEVNKYGCDTCNCLRQPMDGQCPMRKCVPCSFGMAFDIHRCQTCDCLPNPCKGFDCHGNQVCEVSFECLGETCRHLPRCLENSEVDVVDLDVTYSHQQLVDFDVNEFIDSVKDHMSNMFEISKDFMYEFKVEEPGKETVEVKFQILNDHQQDLVKEVTRLQSAVKLNSDMTKLVYKEQTYVPVSVDAQYHGESYSGQSSAVTDDEENNMTSVFAVAAVAGVAGIVLIIAVSVVLVLRANRNSNRRQNIIYKRAAMENDYQRPLTVSKRESEIEA